MELKIKDYQLPAPLEFNYEELKAELMTKMHDYETLVYTEDKVKEAKADRATLNGFKKALNDERIRREKEYMAGFQPFKDKVNDLIEIIDKPVGLIDKQVKAFEEELKATKREQIGSIWENTPHPEWLRLPQIFDEKWLNKTVTMKSIELALREKVEQIEKDLTTIRGLEAFAFEAETEYKRTLDLAKAIEEGKRQADIQKAKAEAVKVEETGFMAEISKDEPGMWVAFQAYMTIAQAKELKAYFNAHGIEFKEV